MAHRHHPTGGGGMPAPPGRGRDCSLGFNELNLSPDGTIMSRDQIVEARRSLGFCTTCIDHPTQCYEQAAGRFARVMQRRTPRTVDGEVDNGVCLRCHPPAGSDRRSGRHHRSHGSHGGSHGASFSGSLHGGVHLSHGSSSGGGVHASSGLNASASASSLGEGSESSGGGWQGRSGGHLASLDSDAAIGGDMGGMIIDAECAFISPAMPPHPPALAPPPVPAQPTEEQQWRQGSGISSSAGGNSRGHARSATHTGGDLPSASLSSTLSSSMSSGSSNHQRSQSEADARRPSVDDALRGMLRQNRGHGARFSGSLLSDDDDDSTQLGQADQSQRHMETVAENGERSNESSSHPLAAPTTIARAETAADGGVEPLPVQGDQRRQHSQNQPPPLATALTHQESSASMVATAGSRAAEEEDNLADEDIKKTATRGKAKAAATMVQPSDPRAQRLIEIKLFLQDMITAETPDGDEFAIDQISTLMLEDQTWADLQDYGLTVLSMLGRKTERNKEIIAKGGALGAIVQGMAATIDSVRSQDFGCRALWSTGVAKQNRALIANAGGCKSVVAALEKHGKKAPPDNPLEAEVLMGMVKSALGATKLLTAEGRARDELERNGAPAAVASAMLAHKADQKVQTDGTTVLSNLIIDSVNQRVQVGSAEELTAIVTAMETHPNDEKIQRMACTALLNYTFSDTNTAQLNQLSDGNGRDKLDVVGKLNFVAEHFPSCKRETETVLDRLRRTAERTAQPAPPPMAAVAAAPLGEESGYSGAASTSRDGAYDQHHQQQQQGGEYDAIEYDDPEEAEAYDQTVNLPVNPHIDDCSKVVALTEVMLTFMDSHRVQANGLQGLARLTADSTGVCDAAVQNGGMALVAIIGAMELFGGNDPAVTSRSCDVLCHVAKSSRDNRVAVLESLEGTQRVAGIMGTHLDDCQVQVSGIGLLGALTERDGGSGGASGDNNHAEAECAVREALKRFGSSQAIQEEGNRVLDNISDGDSKAGHLNWSSGGVEDPAADCSIGGVGCCGTMSLQAR